MNSSSIRTLVRTSETRSNLNISWLRNAADLRQAEEEGIVSLYQAAFADPPYEEAFAEDEVREIFADILRAGGFLFAAQRADSLGRIIAFVASIPLTEKPDIVAFLSQRRLARPESACYFAEDAVEAKFRRQGISAEMKRLLIGANMVAGYETMVLRTSANPLNVQRPAVRKAGFESIPGSTQYVMSRKKDGIERPDERSLFLYDMRIGG